MCALSWDMEFYPTLRYWALVSVAAASAICVVAGVLRRWRSDEDATAGGRHETAREHGLDPRAPRWERALSVAALATLTVAVVPWAWTGALVDLRNDSLPRALAYLSATVMVLIVTMTVVLLGGAVRHYMAARAGPSD